LSATSVSSAPSSSVQFSSLGLAPILLQNLEREGYRTPTPIQAQSIPHGVRGRDLLGIAQTGTGKTASFALPILHQLLAAGVSDAQRRKPRALVLAPTRELAAQIGESFAAYGRGTGLRHAVIFGGVGQGPQVAAIRKGIDILVATPGRLLDLMGQKLVDLGDISFLVLDEADRMLDMGFIHDIRKVIGALPPRERKPRQVMFYSATMPREISDLVSGLLRDPARVEVTPAATTVERIDQSVHLVARDAKMSLLTHLLDDPAIARVLVFTRTKHGADRVAKKLKSSGFGAEPIHGNRSQSQRVRALEAFRSGGARILVATDIAARGIDVDGITHVINYDLPVEPEAYVHRIGRTARAGADGVAISFCDAEERPLLKDIERLARIEIRREVLPEALAAFGVAERVSRGELEGGGDRPAKRSGRGPNGRSGGRPEGRDQSRGGGNPGNRGPSHGGGRPAHASGGKSKAAPTASSSQTAPRHSHPLASSGGAVPGFRAIKNAGRGRGRR
jgi:ATP-dependent RNA helicase RhlE